MQRHSRRTVEKERRNIKRWRNRKVWTRPRFSTSSFIFFYLFLVARGETSHTARQLWSYTIKLEVASRSSRLASTILWTVTQVYHVNGARALVQLTVTNTCLQIVYTSDTSLPTDQNVGETCWQEWKKISFRRQQFADWFFLPFTHTHANLSLPEHISQPSVCYVKATLVDLPVNLYCIFLVILCRLADL